MTNFNFKKNICLNCLESLIKERENSNINLNDEMIKLKESLLNLSNEFDLKEYNQYKDISEFSLIDEERNLILEISKLKQEEKQTNNELNNLLLELSKLYKEEKNYWNIYNQIEDLSLKHEKSKQLTINKYKIYESEIKQFSDSSLINWLFNITCFDKYGVINGARLGFGSSIIADEINAGIGYIIFLISIIAKKYSYDFIKFELIPMGNYSKIINKKTGFQYDLHTAGVSKVSIEKFNDSLVMLLEALNELNEYLTNSNKINQKTPDGDLNIKISNDSINGYSIKYDYNYPDNWSQCMKFMLILLKSYIYFVLKKEDDEYKDILDKAKILSTLNY